MLEKLDPDFIGRVAAAIGWLAFLVVTVRAAIRHIAGTATTREDKSLAETLNRDLLKVIADQAKEQTEALHRLEVKQAKTETRLTGLEAHIRNQERG